MPPRKKKVEVELANLPMNSAPPGAEFQILSPTEERRERELEEILAELTSDARVKVSQVIDGKVSYAGDMSADGFTLDALLEAFGGGDKRLVIMQGKQRVESVTVSLDPSIPPKNPKTPKAATNGGTGSTNDMLNVFGAMAAQQASSAQMMTQMMGGIVSALTAVMTATATQRTDPVAQAVQIATVLKGNGGGMSEAFEMFREGITLGERFGGGKEDDGVMAVVGKGLETLGVLVDGIVTTQKAKAAALLRTPGALPPGEMAPASAAPMDGGDVSNNSHTGDSMASADGVGGPPWVLKVRPHMGALVSASKFMPATAAADTIASMLTDDEFGDLVDDITNQEGGGFGVRLAEYFPVASGQINVEWLAKVIEVLLTEHVEPDELPGTNGAPS